MSGGLTEDNSWVDPFIHLTEQELLDRMSGGLRYSHLPGTTYEYSNLGYTLAGLAVGRAVGQTIEDFVTTEVLRPLGLTSTFFDSAAPADIERATGWSLDTHGQWTAYAPNVSQAFAAAGGILSTVRDLATWVAWLGSAFRAPDPDDVGILSRASRRELQRIHVLDTPSLALTSDGGIQPRIGGYGLGLFITIDLQRGTLVSHGGGLPGFSLFMCWHPDSGHGVVVLTNSHRGNTTLLCKDALGRVLARDTTPSETIVLWPATVQLRVAVERLIRNWDDDLAAQIFADNVEFDRPLAQRRSEIAEAISQVGPLGDLRPPSNIVSSTTAADVTWSIPVHNGELLCMIHLTPVEPPQVQELVVKAILVNCPRSATPIDISPRRAYLGETFISPLTNVHVDLP